MLKQFSKLCHSLKHQDTVITTEVLPFQQGTYKTQKEKGNKKEKNIFFNFHAVYMLCNMKTISRTILTQHDFKPLLCHIPPI